MNPGLSRRRLLVGGAAALGAVSMVRAADARAQEPTADALAQRACWGEHQAGLEPPLQANASFIGLDLRPGIRRGDLVRLMTVWADDIARLASGRPTLADTSPELAGPATGLTITVGFGPGLFDVPGLGDARPSWLQPLPEFSVDRLEEKWSGGDLLLQLRSEDPLDIAHAQQMLLTNANEFARVRWVQRGFHRSAAVREPGATGRNLMGYVDGTVNPAPATDDFARVVWVDDGPAWLRGGTGMVLRRIRMDLDLWGAVDRPSRELLMGRRLDNGAPITGEVENDVPDLEARDPSGLLTIPEFAHIRLAHQRSSDERMSRQPYNYDDTTGIDRDAGLLFVAYAADPVRQFVPIQRRLAKGDAMNRWTTPVGSAVFAIPPGFQAGGYPGQQLLG